jgi:hypothetical protein
MYNKISRDSKHRNCTILRYLEVKNREFEQWSGEYVDINEFNTSGINLLLPHGEINILTITSTQAVSMIRRINAHLLVNYENTSKIPLHRRLTDK